VRIHRLPGLTEPQFFGCIAAFVDSLTGEMNAAALALRRLEGQPKGRAFSHEMALDAHRYGALIVLDRWATLVRTFGPHLAFAKSVGIVDQTAARVRSAEDLLGRVNQLIDAAASYGTDLVEACALAFQSVAATFSEERDLVEQNARLGPMLPPEYSEARQTFLEDLAAR
jgi:hypothetical protein